MLAEFGLLGKKRRGQQGETPPPPLHLTNPSFGINAVNVQWV